MRCPGQEEGGAAKANALSEIRTRVNCVAGNYDTPTLTTLACQDASWSFELTTLRCHTFQMYHTDRCNR